ncbi:MAG: helix-turn-helix transcriptional regulator, partial [Erysipelotrichaceae bacterium]|nr:helix-turn-helix transcriptional regulator [Erysipelotrichaceae bacterium]
MLDTQKIGLNLRRLRVENGLTQDMVAERLFVSRQAVSNWEQG